MEKIKLLDTSFSHSILGYCSDFQKSDYFTWERDFTQSEKNCIVYTDSELFKISENGNNFAWLIEPICINGSTYDFIRNNFANFTKVFTHEKELLELNDKFHFIPFGGCWIKPEDQRVYQKTKNLSIISSNKNHTDGHKLRHEIIKLYENHIDIFGRGYNPIEFKIDGLKDYKFQIVIENCKRDYWFTEKLIDCFRTGTIPIYWGCPSIGDFFDVNGMIIFNDLNELSQIINSLSYELYESKIISVHKNFDLSKNFLLPDDHIYKFLKDKNFL